MDSQGQGYQKQNLYNKIMQGEKFYDSDLTYIALNYGQKIEVKEDLLKHHLYNKIMQEENFMTQT